MIRVSLTLFVLAMAASCHAADRPNVLFIYADDWGWGDLACHGRPGLKTPHLDQLAREGSDFINSPSATQFVRRVAWRS